MAAAYELFASWLAAGTANALTSALLHPLDRARVLQLGEEPGRVFNFGAPVLDAINDLQLMSREELEHKFGIRFGAKNILMTFHPAAFDVASAKFMIDELLAAMEAATTADGHVQPRPLRPLRPCAPFFGSAAERRLRRAVCLLCEHALPRRRRRREAQPVAAAPRLT
jgi:hypothetical protein